MSKYETGFQTRNKILLTCRSLFYEEGYDNTTFADIARTAEVNQGSIYYHFSSKENILGTIMEETIAKNDSIVEEYSSEDTLYETKYFMGGRIYLYKMLQDEEYRRFNIDAIRLFNSNSFARIMELVYKQEHFSDDEPLIRCFQGMANTSFEMMVRLFFVQNIASYSVEEIFHTSLEIFRRIMDIDNKNFAVIQCQMKGINEKIPWKDLDTSLDVEKKYKK